jgi:hypothetical protein
MSTFPQVDPSYDEFLVSREVPHEQWSECKKWVRYYLHFCASIITIRLI